MALWSTPADGQGGCRAGLVGRHDGGGVQQRLHGRSQRRPLLQCGREREPADQVALVPHTGPRSSPGISRRRSQRCGLHPAGRRPLPGVSCGQFRRQQLQMERRGRRLGRRSTNSRTHCSHGRQRRSTGQHPATGVPTISGTAQVGETLAADTSGISDEDGLDQCFLRTISGYAPMEERMPTSRMQRTPPTRSPTTTRARRSS